MREKPLIGLVSPLEPPELKMGGLTVSLITEERGADILLFPSPGGKLITVGIQRKTFPADFIQSLEDGRLVRELSLLRHGVAIPILLNEGQPIYSGENLVVNNKISRYTRRQIRSLLLSIKFIRGVDVEWTDNIQDTKVMLKEIFLYFSKSDHTSIFQRPGLEGEWGKTSKLERWLWILQGFGGVGPKLAKNIVGKFGHLPLKWSCTLDQLKEVRLIGPSRAKALWDTLPQDGLE